MSSPKKQNFISTNLYPPAYNIIPCKRKTNFQCGQWRLPKHIGHQNTFSTWSALCMNNKSKMHYRTYHLLGFSWAWDLIFFLDHTRTRTRNLKIFWAASIRVTAFFYFWTTTEPATAYLNFSSTPALITEPFSIFNHTIRTHHHPKPNPAVPHPRTQNHTCACWYALDLYVLRPSQNINPPTSPTIVPKWCTFWPLGRKRK